MHITLNGIYGIYVNTKKDLHVISKWDYIPKWVISYSPFYQYGVLWGYNWDRMGKGM